MRDVRVRKGVSGPPPEQAEAEVTTCAYCGATSAPLVWRLVGDKAFHTWKCQDSYYMRKAIKGE